MKKLLSIVLLLSFSVITYGQDEASLGQHQFSINASTFIKNFFSFNNNAIPSSPYQMMYRNIRPSGNALRAQLGLLVFQTYSEDNEGDDNTTFTSSTFESTFGFEKRTTINKRWVYYFGGQMLLNYQQDITKNSSGSFNSKSEDLAYSLGLGAIAGIQFNINDRLSLGTEGGLPLMYTNITESFTVDNDLTKDKAKLLSLSPTLPSFIYFNIIIK